MKKNSNDSYMYELIHTQQNRIPEVAMKHCNPVGQKITQLERNLVIKNL